MRITFALAVENKLRHKKGEKVSRARSITINGNQIWFQMYPAKKATDEQLELLASAENVDLEEILEAGITQSECITRLRKALGQVPEIPEYIRKRRDKFREQRRSAPPCRVCGKEGDSTKHHFVNRWILRELESYERLWSNRRENCIPVCIDCHRDLHDRNGTPKSIAHLLTEKEKAFADRALSALSEQRPKMFMLIVRGSSEVYEAQLLKDWIAGRFECTGVKDNVSESSGKIGTPFLQPITLN